MTAAYFAAGIAAFAVVLFIALAGYSAVRLCRELLAKHRQQQPDEHSQFLGADAGGSFIHHGSVSE